MVWLRRLTFLAGTASARSTSINSTLTSAAESVQFGPRHGFTSRSSLPASCPPNGGRNEGADVAVFAGKARRPEIVGSAGHRCFPLPQSGKVRLAIISGSGFLRSRKRHSHREWWRSNSYPPAPLIDDEIRVRVLARRRPRT